MNLKDFAGYVNYHLKQHTGEEEVVVALKGGAYARDFAPIRFIGAQTGEKTFIKIEPQNRLIQDPETMKKGLAPLIENGIHASGRRWRVLRCGRCEERLRKDDRFCSRCGQKIFSPYKSG